MGDEGIGRGAHLVGSLNVPDAEAAFRLAADALGERLARFPDGETGARREWVGAQMAAFLGLPDLELVPPAAGSYPPTPQLRLAAGAQPADLEIGDLGIADAALASFRVFRRLQAEGVLPGRARFQVGVPSPLAFLATRVAPESRGALAGPYLRALRAELGRIFEAVPAALLAIQWELPVEVGMIEGVFDPAFVGGTAGLPAQVARLVDLVPEPAEVGLHFCYGDAGGRPFIRPTSLRVQVDLLRGALSAAGRKLTWAHLAVPAGCASPAFFAPLADLAAFDGELFLGLIDADAPGGAEDALRQARAYRADFGVATSCGLGRRGAGTLRAVLEAHCVHAA